MRSKFLSLRVLAPVALLSLSASVSGRFARADDMSPPPATAPTAPAAPKDASKPVDPAKPVDPVKPSDPAKPESPAEPAKVKAPEFTLKDLDGKDRKLSEFAGKWVVLEWTNYGCPFVKKHYDPQAMQALQTTYTAKGVVWLSICSSAEGKQGAMTADAWKKAVADYKAAPTALLLDGDGTVGHLYNAHTTPDMRIIDPTGNLVYAGAIDDDPSMKSDPTKAKNFVALDLDAALAGRPLPFAETKSYGCSVKYAK